MDQIGGGEVDRAAGDMEMKFWGWRPGDEEDAGYFENVLYPNFEIEIEIDQQAQQTVAGTAKSRRMRHQYPMKTMIGSRMIGGPRLAISL